MCSLHIQINIFCVVVSYKFFVYDPIPNRSTGPIDVTSTGTTSLDQSGLESNGHEELFHIGHMFTTGVSPSDADQRFFKSTHFMSDSSSVGIVSVY